MRVGARERRRTAGFSDLERPMLLLRVPAVVGLMALRGSPFRLIPIVGAAM